MLLSLAGRKGRDFYRRRDVKIESEFINIFSKLNYGHAKDIAEKIIQAYSSAEIDAVYLSSRGLK